MHASQRVKSTNSQLTDHLSPTKQTTETRSHSRRRRPNEPTRRSAPLQHQIPRRRRSPDCAPLRPLCRRGCWQPPCHGAASAHSTRCPPDPVASATTRRWPPDPLLHRRPMPHTRDQGEQPPLSTLHSPPSPTTNQIAPNPSMSRLFLLPIIKQQFIS
jgi:hypothetical protein